jgi:hypothetical protein
MRLITHDENSVIHQHLHHSFSKRKPPYEIILLQLLNHHDCVWVIVKVKVLWDVDVHNKNHVHYNRYFSSLVQLN